MALDSTPILGKGAVKDTYNLLAEGIEQLACRLAEVEGERGAAWAEGQGFSGYFGSSLKGEAAIEWNDKAQREPWLTAIVQDARRLLSLAEQAQAAHADDAGLFRFPNVAEEEISGNRAVPEIHVHLFSEDLDPLLISASPQERT